MNSLNAYFRGLRFDRVAEKKGYAVYAAAIHSMIGGDKQQYVIAFVPVHLAIKASATIEELPWNSLQTRLCPINTYPTKKQPWVLDHNLENMTLNLQERTNRHSRYISENGDFETLMLHNPKNKSIYQYQSSINLHWAIDQFNTCFVYVGEIEPMEYTSIPSESIPLPHYY